MSASARFWAFFPVILSLLMIGGLVTMATIASRDPGFAVEKDYYKKAVGYDATEAQARENARLGWRIECTLERRGTELEVAAVVKDRDGARIDGATVDVEAFANARASNIAEARLAPDANSTYSARVPLRDRGLFELRFVVQARGSRYTEVVRRDAS